MAVTTLHTLGIDIGSTTVKVAVLSPTQELLFSDYRRHYANIQETLAALICEAREKLGDLQVSPVITGSGGLTLANHLEIPFVQEVIAVASSLEHLVPQTDVAIELGGEDAKIIYFENGNVEQRMNGICAGGTGSFIDQMASLLQTDASADQRGSDKGRSFRIYFPGSCQSDDFRPGLRQTDPRTRHVSRRSAPLPLRTAHRIYPYAGTG